MGRLASALYDEGMLKTVSVGFIGKERQGEKITKKELLELSFVAVPSNPSAVSLDGKTYEEAVKKGLILEDEFPECVMPLEADGTVSEEEKDCRRKKREEKKNTPMESPEMQEIKSLKSVIETLTSDFSEVKALIKSLADDKAEEKASEETRKAGQELAKALSSYLAQAKKSK